MVAISQYGGASHFANNENYEVQRNNHFEVLLHLDRILPEFPQASEQIRLATKEMAAPSLNTTAIDLKHGNETVKVASAPTFDELTITVYDTIGTDIQGLLQAWFHKIFDPKTRQMGLVKDYKTTAVLYMYSPNSSVIRSWTLYGVFPTKIGVSGNFSYEGTDAVNVDLTLSCDKYVENVEQVQ